MKASGVYLSITLMVTAVIILSRNTYAVDVSKNSPVVVQHESRAVHKVEMEIDADRDKIIEEASAINADRLKLKDAEKVPDKTSAEQVKEEIKKDIEKRDARIKDLKKEIKDKKEQRYLLINGKQKDEPRRTRQDAK